ncbi:MAG: hypothetical protein ACHREM_13405 [Polyangiales bacterium]
MPKKTHLVSVCILLPPEVIDDYDARAHESRSARSALIRADVMAAVRERAREASGPPTSD